MFRDRDSFTRAALQNAARFADHTNHECVEGQLSDAVEDADVFIGVSGPGILSRSDVQRMAPNPIVFALANPVPEVYPDEVADICAVIATGRSDYPNQINNVLAFPWDLPRCAR